MSYNSLIITFKLYTIVLDWSILHPLYLCKGSVLLLQCRAIVQWKKVNVQPGLSQRKSKTLFDE